MTNLGRQRQTQVFLAGLSGKKPSVPTNSIALEHRARRSMSKAAFAYIAGGAGIESTVEANQRAFEQWRIVPRMLTDVSHCDTGIELFGQKLPSPFLLAPIGVLEMAHRNADLAVARAAAAEYVPMIFSSQASKPMEACAAVMSDRPRWFQLYWSQSDDLTLSFVTRAEACGCSAIVVTLDTTMLGWRSRDLDLAYLPFLRGKGIAQYTSDPVFQAQIAQRASDETAETSARFSLPLLRVLWELSRSYPGTLLGNLRSVKPRRAVQHFTAIYSRPSLTWDDLALLRHHTHLPILLKGILHPDDAYKAIDAGMDGIVVSNHGGRQVDGAIGALDALPFVAEVVADRVPIIFDSGIRGGADVFKALALGAKAVCIGRPYAYGLAIAGQRGVQEVIRNFKADFELTMGLAGCRSIAEITHERLIAAKW
ncbi:MAG: lactate 2-monooxygenase [Aggregatilineales bacterium]